MNAHARCLAAALIAIAAALGAEGGAVASAEGTAQTDPMPAHAAPASESQRLGRERLMEMARFLAGLEQLGVTVRGGFDVVQQDGQKVQFLENREVALVRPDRFRAEETRADGHNSSLVFDGTRMTLWNSEQGVFAQADQPGTIDDAILYFVRDLEMRLPLAPLFTTRLPEEFERRLRFVDLVETSYVFEEPAQHIVGRTGIVDFQIWIAAGKQPWPQRLVITYREEPGQPQYWADFSGWTAKPRIAKDLFDFKPPDDARQIAFAVQIPYLAGQAPQAEAGGSEGEQP
jgi:hypothetical protein